MRTALLHQAQVSLIQLSVSQGAEVEHGGGGGGGTAYGPSKHLLYVALSTNDPRTTADALLNQ